MKKFLTLLIMILPALAYAQNRTVSGYVSDKSTKEGIIQATVQLLTTDSAFVKGAISDMDGNFSIDIPQNGKYVLKITSIGYKPFTKLLSLSDNNNMDIGNIAMEADAIMLEGTIVEGHAARVVVKKDTMQYNASAYRVPEGSAVEALVEALPGAQVDENGKITINGKEVKKILIDGKEFMTGDTKTAMKNLPTSMIENIKSYDQKSDLARITGIEDGEEETVLDFGIKRGMNKGLFSNINLSYGTKERYSERGMGAFFNDKMRVMLFAGANNTNDTGFPGGRRRPWARKQGLNASKMVGANFNYDDKKTLKLDGSIRWNHSDGDAQTVGSTESFVNSTGAFSNNKGVNFTRSNSWDTRFRLEWQPDSMTNIMFRPSFRYSSNDGRDVSNSASYNADPYDYVSDPLSESAIAQLAGDSLLINRRNNTALTYTDSKTLEGMLQFNRRLNSKGRNVTLRTDVNYSDNGSNSISVSDVRLYQLRNYLGLDSVYNTNRYNVMPTKNWSYSLQATYSEPIARAMYLQFSYKYQYYYSKSDRTTYDFSNVADGLFNNVIPIYRGWDRYLSLLANPLDSYKEENLSRYSEYKNYIHEIQLMYRLVRDKYQLNAGVMLQPLKSHYTQTFMGSNVDTTRTVTNFTPTFEFVYRFSDISNLRINYRGVTAQPSMADLLDITDDSDPLNIVKGNPGLKPSFTNRFRMFYNNYTQKRQRSIMAFLAYNNTRNSISNKVTYDEKTGGRVSQPENINGNWNAFGAFMLNTAIDTTGYWNVNTFTNFSYNNYVGYINVGNLSSQKNTTRSTTVGERLGFSYRNIWMEIELNGSLNYTNTRNLLQSQNNMDTWEFSYGANVSFTMPWGMSLSTDIHQNSRRGYSDKSMNTNELVWNAQLSQSFLKGKPLTVSLQLYDILNKQSNISRIVNAIQRSDIRYNNINSYAMLNISYKLNIFGGKDNFMHNGPGGGPHRGGFGGGRPGGGFGGH